MSFKFVLLLVIICVNFLTCLAVKNAVKKSPTSSGPYTTIPLEIRECAKPTLPYFEEPVVEFHMNVDKIKHTVSGNYTLLKDVKNFKITLEDHIYQDGKWQLIFKINKLYCHTRFMEYLTRSFRLGFDKKECIFRKGKFSFTVDSDKFDHMWTDTREYGRMLRRVQIYNKSRTIVCYEFESSVVPKLPQKPT